MSTKSTSSVDVFGVKVPTREYVTGLEAEQLDDIRVRTQSGEISSTRADLETAMVFIRNRTKSGVTMEDLEARPFTPDAQAALENLIGPFGDLLRARAVNTLKRTASYATPEQRTEAVEHLQEQIRVIQAMDSLN